MQSVPGLFGVSFFFFCVSCKTHLQIPKHFVWRSCDLDTKQIQHKSMLNVSFTHPVLSTHFGLEMTVWLTLIYTLLISFWRYVFQHHQTTVIILFCFCILNHYLFSQLPSNCKEIGFSDGWAAAASLLTSKGLSFHAEPHVTTTKPKSSCRSRRILSTAHMF